MRAADFILIHVPDMKRARHFYGEILGLPFLVDHERWMEFDFGTLALAVEGGDGEPGASKKNGVVYLAVPDAHEAARELRGKGVEVEEVYERQIYFMAEFQDPFGNTIGLHQRRDGTAG